MMSPCKNCAGRHTACHDHCDKYMAWKAEQTARKEAEQQYKNLGWTYAGSRRANTRSYDRNISPSFDNKWK